ncbi:winged helix-turn-helix domain-containing protein [Streptomyces sp. CA-294286]|uniref:winged helix-turn-helix domain-containing protein n=1 Tax=Streptomyces sp. CA-294286 TaxID=3240070 RepID=UPI003D8F2FCD
MTHATVTRSLPTASPALPRRTAHEPVRPGPHRLRAVERDEVTSPAASPAGLRPAYDVADHLPPGATWLPAPPHVLPALPGRPPMVGYLVLVPADPRPVAAPDVAGHSDGQRIAGQPTVEQPADVEHVGEGRAELRPGAVRIDFARRTAEVDGRALDLTYLEFELLAHLVAHPQRVHTRDRLVTTVWGYGHVGDGRTVDVHIARLRRKLGAEHRHTIQTVRRVGYKYVP